MPTDPPEAATEANVLLTELLCEQVAVIRSINRALENLRKVGRNNITLAIAQKRLSILDANWAKCQQLHGKLYGASTSEERASYEYFTTGQLPATEDIYLTTSDYISNLIAELTPPSAMAEISMASQPPSPGARLPAAVPHQEIRLPKIDLPRFDGTYKNWPSFRDLFKVLVHNHTQISNVQKLQYLKSVLDGEAHTLLQSVSITDANYPSAWQALLTRYDNDRIIISTLLENLMNVESVNQESAKEIRRVFNQIKSSIDALKNMDCPTEQWNHILVFVTVHKLDPATRKAWELSLGSKTAYPTFEALEEFLVNKIHALEAIGTTAGTPDKSSKSSQPQRAARSHVTTNSNVKCLFCQGNHIVARCDDFKGKSIEQCAEFVNNKKLCANCLMGGHTPQTCSNKHRCFKCQRKHHTLLHRNNGASNHPAQSTAGHSSSVATQSVHIVSPDSNSNLEPNQEDRPNTMPSSTNCHLTREVAQPRESVLLGTARVLVNGASNRKRIVRALIDPCSENTIISETIAQDLRLPRTKINTRLEGLNGSLLAVAQAQTRLSINSIVFPQVTVTVDALVCQAITSYQPPKLKEGALKSWPHLQGLELADSNPFAQDRIDLLLGADIYTSLIREGLCKGQSGGPVAHATIFGWVLIGPVTDVTPSLTRTINVHHCCDVRQISARLTKFWEDEDIPSQRHLTEDEARCESHFINTHSRDIDVEPHRYVVRLPFKNGPPIDIGSSYEVAKKQAHRLEHRLSSKPTHRTLYSDFLTEYQTLGHMELVPREDTGTNSQSVYLPHHPVIKESATSTKLRVVFNASSTTSNGSSLNSHLLVGPKLQVELPVIVLRWRMHRVVLFADICKMYRQIKIDRRDADYQQIVYRHSPDTEFSTYRLLTVTYGTASAPFLALRVLKQLALDEGNAFPIGAKILQENFYVDDVLFGADNVESLAEAKSQLIQLLARAGFSLGKWGGTEPSLLPESSMTSQNLQFNESPECESIKVLGLYWNPQTDAFSIKVDLSTTGSVCKRDVLSTIARMYDPMGLLTPVTVHAKIIMQELWLVGTDWDEPLPAQIFQKWQTYFNDLQSLGRVSIPRWTHFESQQCTVQLHGFCDASSHAYAAAVYLRVTTQNQMVATLVYAKSRVAPLKTISIPRLELCAASLLARSIQYVIAALPMNITLMYAWTDSTVVLAWLQKPPAHWKTFVANRVSDIISRLPNVSWRHVPTKNNPTDCASRGIFSSELVNHPLWWSGPPWLIQDSEQWPRTLQNDEGHQIAAETRVQCHLQVTPSHETTSIAERFSSWPKLIRVTALCLRFLYILRIRVKNPIRVTRARNRQLDTRLRELESVDFIAQARLHWLQTAQRELFAPEITAISRGKPIAASSSLLRLTPILNSTGLLIVRGRLANSPLAEAEKHPIIIAKHHITALLIRHAHLRTLHGGAQLTGRVLRQEYWILNARAQIKHCIRNCTVCIRQRAQTFNPLMSDLPNPRVTPVSRPFTHCGVDYAGPMNIRVSKLRKAQCGKAYVCVFVCFATRATHLELVSDCTTEAFIAAFRRFGSRRGFPKVVYSDHGTNFQGADREISQMFKRVTTSPELRDVFAMDGVQWKFIPPTAPHFGELWEAGVKSVKHHLRRTLQNQTLTFEEYTTLLCQIEACLNSRPISPLSADPDDTAPLTPSHFLASGPITSLPESSLLDINENRLNRWQLIQRRVHQFWKIWVSDYLNTLQQRTKWSRTHPNVQLNDLVITKHNTLPPCKWELGRIVQCHPGKDGEVRVVTIKTATSTLTRPVTRVCRLLTADQPT